MSDPDAQTIQRIQELAQEVYEQLGGGYNESVYEQALAYELRQADIMYRRQPTEEILYKGEHVGDQSLDFRIGDLILELKAAANISNSHRGQLHAYLNTAGFNEGLLINFPYPEKDAVQIETVKRPLTDSAESH